MNTKRLFSTLALGLGLALGLLCLLESQNSVALADPGILYVAPGGDCGGATPCYATVQDAVDAANAGDVIKVAQGTYTGVQNVPTLNTGTFTATQIVLITKAITIRGGYTTSDWDSPDPVAHPTTLDAQGQGRVMVITGDIAPTIEGLRITGGDATGLGSPWWGDAGGGVYVINATATISNNQVFSNIAGSGKGFGGGLLLYCSDATLNSNVIYSNTGRWGGGSYLGHSDATLSANTIFANVASLSGGGLYLENRSDATLSANTVISNTAFYGGGLYLGGYSDPTLSSNTVMSNTADYGGGLYLWHSDATLTSNTVVSNLAKYGMGGGLYVVDSAPKLISTVVADNQGSAAGSGLYMSNSSPRLLHTTIARNGGGSGVYVTNGGDGNYSTVEMTNTILVSHTVGITVTAGNTATLNATLWYANGTDYNSNVFHTNDHTGDPAFAADGYHLTAASAAIDKGVDAGAVMDIDSDTRPQGAGFDLGADEFMSMPAARREIYLPLAVRG